MPLRSETKQLNAYLVGTGFNSPKAGILLIFVSESSSQRLTVLKCTGSRTLTLECVTDDLGILYTTGVNPTYL